MKRSNFLIILVISLCYLSLFSPVFAAEKRAQLIVPGCGD